MKPLPERTELVAILKEKLNTDKDVLAPDKPHDYKKVEITTGIIGKVYARCVPHHWGLVELRAFLDELYGGPPTSKDEELNVEDHY